MNKVDAEKLFQYADKFARRKENTGKGTCYPTVRQAAKRFGVPQSEIVDVVEGAYIEDGYFGLAVAIGISGVGHAALEGGDQQIEAYRHL